MLRLALVLVVGTAGSAFAEGQPPPQATQQAAPPQPAPSPPRPRCQVAPMKGTPLFEARYAGGVGINGKTVTTKLYATGTFTRVIAKAKQKPATRTSCIEKTKVELLTKLLGAAPWTITRNNEACQAVSGESTEIYVEGKKRFTVKMCSHLVLDEETDDALDRVATAVGHFGIDLVDDLTDE